MQDKWILEWLKEDDMMSDKDILNLNIKEIKSVRPDYQLSMQDLSALSTFLKDYKYQSSSWKYDTNTKKHYFSLDYEMIFRNMNNLSNLNQKSYYKAINNEIERIMKERENKNNGK